MLPLYSNLLNEVYNNQYKAVIFDCFGTILTIKKNNTILQLLKKHNQLSKRSLRFILTSKLNFDSILNTFNIKLSKEEYIYYQSTLEEEISSIDYISSFKPIFEKIQSTHKTLICSNLSYMHSEKLNEINSLKVLSFEVGHIKPEKEIYVCCIKKLRLTPSEILFVGDNYVSDFLAPKKFGIDSFFLTH